MKRLFGYGASLSYIKAMTKEKKLDFVPVVNLKLIYLQENFKVKYKQTS